MFRLPIFGRRIERKGVGGDGGGDEYDIRLEVSGGLDKGRY